MSPDFAQTLGNDVERTGENNCWTSPDGPPKKILATTNRSEENLMRTQPSRQVGCNALLGEKVVSWGMISSPEYHKHFNKIEHQKAPLLVPWIHSRSMSFSHFCQNPKKSPPKIAKMIRVVPSNPTVCYQPAAGTSRCFSPVEVISFNTVLHALRHAWLRSILLLSEMEDFTVRHKRRVGMGEGMFYEKKCIVVYKFINIFIYTDIYSIYTWF